jgi:hypothetical protein
MHNINKELNTLLTFTCNESSDCYKCPINYGQLTYHGQCMGKYLLRDMINRITGKTKDF